MTESIAIPEIGTVSLCGNLASFRLFDLLTLLHLCRKTGTLELRFERSSATTYFQDGQLIFATTDQERLRLGRILCARNLITPEQEAQIQALRTTASERFGQIALRLGFITEEQLSDALKVQVSEIIYDALPRLEGRFAFVDGMELPDYAVTIVIDVPNLIMEGARRIDEWEQCLELLPNESAVFRMVPQPDVQEKISLSREEWRILFMIDGQRTLEQIVAAVGEEPLNTYRIVYGLLASKLIEEITPEPVRRTLSGAIAAPEPSATEKIRKISPEELEERQGDTRLLVSRNATLSLRDISREAAEIVTLDVRLPDGRRKTIPLVEESYTVGRSRECSIRFTDSTVSARHMTLTRTSEGWVLEDLGSRNGTQVNQRTVERCTLRNGDEIEVGDVQLVYMVGYRVT